MPDFEAIALAWQELTVLRDAVTDPLSLQALELARELAAPAPAPDQVARVCRELAVRLVEWAELSTRARCGDAWQEYLVDRILEGNHVLGRKASLAPADQIGASLLEMAAADLERLRVIYDLTSGAAQQACAGLGLNHMPTWDKTVGLAPDNAAPVDPADELRRQFHQEDAWAPLIQPLANRYYKDGVGSMAQFLAFRWHTEEGFVGVPRPDPIALDDLVGYDYQKQSLIQNTRQFLAAVPCNNILLYGARGTGKSSLVKALLNTYAREGLRLVEVAREDIQQFPEIVRRLRGRPQRFLLFADDLSYDDSELHYRELKAALEGSIEGRPENVLLYATSNRRHLIRERFRDREAADDEIHTHDTVQEKLSLSDRFGLTLSFPPPSQADYLRMVETITLRRGIRLNREDLHARALRWAALHNIPSGRTARQFVDDLQGREGLNASG